MKMQIVIILCFGLIFAACSTNAAPPEPTETSAPSATLAPTATPTPMPTLTPVPTETPTPTHTPLPALITTEITSMRQASLSPWDLMVYGLIKISPDMRHVAFADVRGSKVVVTMNDTVTKGYQNLGLGGIEFSPDSQHWFMVAFVSEEEIVIVTDGNKEGPIGTGLVPGLTPKYSADNQHLYYAIMQGDKAIFVVDGQAGKPYDEIASSLWLSEAGGHYAYLAREGESWMAVVNGEESTRYDEIYPNTVEFSKDGLYNLVFEARRGEDWYLVNGSEESGPYDDIDHGFLLCADGTQILFSAKTGGKYYGVVNGTPGKAYDEILYMDYDQTEMHLYYIARIGTDLFYVIDGQELGPFETWPEDTLYYNTIVFSPDAQRLAYIVREPNGYQIVLDGQASEVYEDILYHEFSAKEQHTYTARKNNQMVIVANGNVAGSYSSLFDLVRYPNFSPDSKYIWFLYEDDSGLEHLGMDGVDSAGYQDIFLSLEGPAFSPDSEHMAFAAQKEENAYVVVVDGVESPVFEGMYKTVIFSPNSQQAAFVAQEADAEDWQVYTWDIKSGEIAKIGEAYDAIKDRYYTPEGILVYVAGLYKSEPGSQFERYGYPLQEGDQWFVVVNGQAGQAYDLVYFYEEQAFEEPGRVQFLVYVDKAWAWVNQAVK